MIVSGSVSLLVRMSQECEVDGSVASTDTDVFEVLTEVACPRSLKPVKDPQHPSMWEADAGRHGNHNVNFI